MLEIKHSTLGVFTKGILHLWLEKGALLTWELLRGSLEGWEVAGEHPGLPYSTTAEPQLVQPQGHTVLQGSRF